jgi:hypothetical protein
MARPGLIAALLLPLPFAALPLVAVLLGGPSFNSGSDTAVYAPVSSPIRDEDKAASMPSSRPGVTTSFADDYRDGCDDYAAES